MRVPHFLIARERFHDGAGEGIWLHQQCAAQHLAPMDEEQQMAEAVHGESPLQEPAQPEKGGDPHTFFAAA